MGKEGILILALIFLLPLALAYDCSIEGIASYNGQKIKNNYVSAYNTNGFLSTAQKGETYGEYKLIIEDADLPIYLTVKDTLADDYEMTNCGPGINLLNLDVTDKDQDGFGMIEDCDDTNPNLFPKSVPVTKKDYEKDCSSTEDNCIEAWSCSAWSECINGRVFRECNDLKNCHTAKNKPLEEDLCSSAINAGEDKKLLNSGEADMITGNVVLKTAIDPIFIKKTFAVVFMTLTGVLCYTFIFKRK